MQEVSVKPTGYEFTVMGEYTARGPNGKISKFFRKEVFILPEIVTYRLGNKWHFYMEGNQKKKKSVPNIITQNATHCFKHIIKKYLLPPRLRDKHEDFIRVRKFNVTKKRRVNLEDSQMARDLDKVDIEDMTESELLQFIAIKDLKVDITPYPDLADKIMAVALAHQEKQAAQNVEAKDEVFDIMMHEADGVRISEGRVSSDDGVPVDDEQKINEFL